MASIAELIDSRQYTRDRNGKEAGTRVFRVLEAQNEAGARDEFYALTDYNRFPGAGIGCILDRVNVEGRNGNTLFIVTASYSSFGGFLKRDEPEEAFVPFFGWGYKKATVTLPFITPITVTTNSGESSVTRIVWTAKTVNIVENRLIRTLKVRYETDNSNTLDVIAEQDRKLHRIRGKQYLFTGADVQQDLKDPNVFLITYQWEQDNDTRFLNVDNPRVQVFLGGTSTLAGTVNQKPDKTLGVGYLCGAIDTFGDVVLSGGNFEVRKPYTQIDLTAQTSEDGAPRPCFIKLFEEDDDGWQQLPGMIPL